MTIDLAERTIKTIDDILNCNGALENAEESIEGYGMVVGQIILGAAKYKTSFLPSFDDEAIEIIRDTEINENIVFPDGEEFSTRELVGATLVYCESNDRHSVLVGFTKDAELCMMDLRQNLVLWIAAHRVLEEQE